MKMTVILGAKGELLAAHHGPILNPHQTEPGGKSSQAGVMAGPGQKLHEIDVPDDFAKITDVHDFSTKIKPHLPRH